MKPCHDSAALHDTAAAPAAAAGDHALTPVPEHLAVPGWRVALVCIGIAFTLTCLYTGSELAAALGMAQGIKAVLIGCLVLAAMSVPAAVLGVRTRLSTYMIVRHTFGHRGARVINGILALVLLGWYAVTAELFGRTCYLTVSALLHSAPLPQWWYTVACSALVTVTAMFGFQAIERLSLAAAPLLVLLTAVVAWRALELMPWTALLAAPAWQPAAQGGAGATLATGISAVVGGMIVGVVLMPDITRYARTSSDCVLIGLAGNGVGYGAALVLAMAPALAFHEIDPIRYMAALGMTGAAIATLVLSTWAINAVNLYSTGLVSSTVLERFGYRALVAACGVAGTLLAVAGIAGHLIGFLSVLGVIVPPIAAVYLADYFVLGRRDLGTPAPGANLPALAACLLGALVGLCGEWWRLSLSGVPAIESFACAALAYVLAERIAGGKA